MKKPNIVYQEDYKQPGLQIKADRLPKFPHAAEGFKIESAFITRAGVVNRAGERLEFQDIRIYFKER